MGAGMLSRTFYLPAGQSVNLIAAKSAATDLATHASPDDLRILLQHDWIDVDQITDQGTVTDEQLSDLAPQLRAKAEQVLHELLDRFAASLATRDVHGYRFSRTPDPIDAYTTGGKSWGDAPTEAHTDWEVVFDSGAFPDNWPLRLGAAAGLLHPFGAGPAVATVAFHAWG